MHKFQQKNFATKVRKSLEKSKFFGRKSVFETKSLFIRHVWHFLTTLWHIFKTFALCDKIQQSQGKSFAERSNNLWSADFQDSHI